MNALKKAKIEKQYVKSGKPISPSSQKRIDDLIAAAKRRNGETQFNARVGDTVWCKFKDTSKGVVNPGTIIEINIDTATTTYRVLPDFSADYEWFIGEDFGKSIFTEEDLFDRYGI